MFSHPDIIGDTGMSRHHAVAPATYLTPLPVDSRKREDDIDDDFDWDEPAEQRLPEPEPTRAAPGSPKKIAILAARYDAGVDLWHDDDLTAFPGRVYSVDNAE